MSAQALQRYEALKRQVVDLSLELAKSKRTPTMVFDVDAALSAEAPPGPRRVIRAKRRGVRAEGSAPEPIEKPNEEPAEGAALGDSRVQRLTWLISARNAAWKEHQWLLFEETREQTPKDRRASITAAREALTALLSSMSIAPRQL